MRIFYVAQRVPFPPDRGDKITTYNEIRHLALRHEVHVFCIADGVADMENVAGARRVVASVTAVAVHPWRAKLRALWALFTGRALSVAMMDEPALHAAIREAQARLLPEVIIAYSSNVAQFVEPFTGTCRIMQFADLDSLKWTRFAEDARLPMRFIYALEGRRLLEYERRIARSFSHSLVCTDAELADFERVIPGAPVSTVRNGVDLEMFRPIGGTKTVGGIVFTGVMDYFPNVDAVVWFCEAILPRVQAAMPGASFVICGSRPSPVVLALASRAGVTVTGRVPEVQPFLDAAEIFVAPLRIARGIQNKVLEAMAMGLPVVASIPAWRGTAIAAGDGILASDDAAEFADQVIRLLREPAYRLAMGRAARAAVERDYAWATQMAVLDGVIEQALAADAPAFGRSPGIMADTGRALH